MQLLNVLIMLHLCFAKHISGWCILSIIFSDIFVSCRRYPNFGIITVLFIYAIWLIVIFLYLRSFTVWLTIPFAFLQINTSLILLFSQIPNDLTILFFGSSTILLWPKIISLSSSLHLVFITMSFDLDPFISISLALKNSSAISRVLNNCSLLFAIQVVSSAYAIAACLYFVTLVLHILSDISCSTV